MELKDVVKEKYDQAALRVSTGGSSCCGASQTPDGCDPITSNLYDSDQMTGMPEQAVKASLGCGNPTALCQSDAGISAKAKLNDLGLSLEDVAGWKWTAVIHSL